MIRLFWAVVWFAAEFFAVYGLQFNRTFRSAYKHHNPHHHIYTNPENEIVHITPHEDHELELLYKGGEEEVMHEMGKIGNKANSGNSDAVPFSTIQEKNAPVGHKHGHVHAGGVVASETGTTMEQATGENGTKYFGYRHWYKIFYARVRSNNTWIPSSVWVSWIWFFIYAANFVGMVHFWYKNNDLPDFPQVDTWSTYDTTILLMIIARFLNSGWFMMFWGSGGFIWRLRGAFLTILGTLALGITILVFLYTVNWIAFGLYVAYTLWALFVTYYTGVFLSVAYDLYPRKKRKMYTQL